MTEYVLTIARRDRDHPLKDEEVLVEFGQADAEKFVGAVLALADMLRVLRTPEKVASFIRENEMLGRTDLVLSGGR